MVYFIYGKRHYIHNAEPLPVVKYKLLDCQNIEALDWTLLDPHNDGVIVTLIPNGSRQIFQTADMSGIQFEIKCEKVIQENNAYSPEDLTDLLKENERQLDSYAILVKRLNDKVKGISNFLEKELDSNLRKLKGANWLTEDKKQFLHGQIAII